MRVSLISNITTVLAAVVISVPCGAAPNTVSDISLPKPLVQSVNIKPVAVVKTPITFKQRVIQFVTLPVTGIKKIIKTFRKAGK